MAEAYPIELRERVVNAYEAGDGSYTTVAVAFSLGEATVKRWVWLRRKTGELAAQAKGGGNASTITAADIESILAKLGDANAGELTAAFNKDRRGSARVHVSSINVRSIVAATSSKKTLQAVGVSPAGRRRKAQEVSESGRERAGRASRVSRRVRTQLLDDS